MSIISKRLKLYLYLLININKNYDYFNEESKIQKLKICSLFISWKGG